MSLFHLDHATFRSQRVSLAGPPRFAFIVAAMISCSALPATATAAQPPEPVFNRAPLAEKTYAELPLGAIEPREWLRNELERMAAGVSGHLDEWYPEVCGDSNAWLGGNGDNWERGPYWIDGLYPLSKLLHDKSLESKAMRWVNWTIEHQRDDGYIGPPVLSPEDQRRPIPEGVQIENPADWWPRMVMLKILQQHILATGDQRAIQCLERYFQYQLKMLPVQPLHDKSNPRSGSWWATQRGGDNLLVVLWLYNLTGDKSLLKLAELLYQQTVPVTTWFEHGPQNMLCYAGDQGPTLHGVNLAQMMKTPTLRWQQDRQQRHLDATETAFSLIRNFHGQPNGMYGGDEHLHGRGPSRGSELCSAVELMYSLESMLEITGNPLHADRLERIAFNALPTQCTDDYRARQYFQQTNQVLASKGSRDFFNDEEERVVFGLTTGYVCCTCNLHQGWPKFTQHLWFATNDHGLAALAYAPSSVTAKVADGQVVTLRQSGGYPFKPLVKIDVHTNREVEFPLHLRIPGWCDDARLELNGKPVDAKLNPASIHIARRLWHDGDQVSLHLPMRLKTSRWFQRSVAIERGPLVLALDVPSTSRTVKRPGPEGTSTSAADRGYIEFLPLGKWNYGIPEATIRALEQNCTLTVAETISDNPWTNQSAPVELTTFGVELPEWQLNRNSAADPPLSPVTSRPDVQIQPLRLIPYGATTLRIAEIPTVVGTPVTTRAGDMILSASHVFERDSLAAVHDSHVADSPRHTFWPHRGGSEWLQCEFDKPRTLQRITISWYQDVGHGSCRTPKSWKLLYRNGNAWTPLPIASSSNNDSNDVTIITFAPVTTNALRLELELRDNFSAGIREWDFE
ncbi:MAG: glycoside hydrolase family 127 protein [Pirellulales bacterium]|nr:glycoside hydrolase family 127 protein [Pirellulales bacterium]